MKHWPIVSCVVILLFSKCTAKSYRDHLLIHGIPKSEPEMEFFRELDSFYNVTFWQKPSFVNRSVQFSLSRVNFAELVRDTKEMNIEFLTVIRDLQRGIYKFIDCTVKCKNMGAYILLKNMTKCTSLFPVYAFDNQTIKPYMRRQMESFDWQNYHSVEDIYNWLRDISEMHPEIVKLQTIGQSVQKRHILALRLELEKSKSMKRSTVIIEGGCHAREWISPAFITYMINTFLNSNASGNQELKDVVNSHIWFFIPLLNPDGYAYSQTTDRLWRKNYHGTYGVDLNRNFGVAFGKFGTTEKKDSEEFCGELPFSEPESSALATFVRENSYNLEYYMAFHSYGQYIIVPYAFEEDHFDNYDEVKKYADKINERSSKRHQIYYHIGTAYDTVGYKASGISVDWVKRSVGVPYAVTIELPDQGFYGFAMPKEEILPICEATMDSILPFFVKKNDTLRTEMSNGVKGRKSLYSVFVSTFSILLLIGLNTNL